VRDDYRKILKKHYKKGKFTIIQRPNCNNDFKKIYDVFHCGVYIACFDTNSIRESFSGYRFYIVAVNKKFKPTVHIDFNKTHVGVRIDFIEIINPELLAQFYFTKKVLIEKTEKPMGIEHITFSSPERLNEFMMTF